MEDNPHPGFVAYDSAMRVGFLIKSLAGETSDGPVLDVCCSKAPFYPYLADRGFDGRVYGVDMLIHQLKIARDRGVKAAQGNVLALPYADKYFSAAIFTASICISADGKRENQRINQRTHTGKDKNVDKRRKRVLHSR